MPKCLHIVSLALSAVAIAYTCLLILGDHSQHRVPFSGVPSAATANRQLNGGERLFGALDAIEPDIMIYSLMILVVGVIALEFLFSIAHKYTADTPYNELVNALEKELMIVGCTAFLFKIYLNQDSTLTSEWVFAIEYADLLVPIFAFSNCVNGFMLVLLSYYLSFFWGRSYHLSNEELIIDFIKDTSNWSRFLGGMLNPGVAQIEFAIVHEIFCDVYRIHDDALAFDLYVKRVLEKLVLEMIEIRTVHWVLLIGLMCFYFVQSQSSDGAYHCHDSDKQSLCKHVNGIYYFTFFGCIMYGITLFTLCVTRYYELQLFRRRGVERIADYPHFLLVYIGFDHEQQPGPGQREKVSRMSRSQLKIYVASLHGTNGAHLPIRGAIPVSDSCEGLESDAAEHSVAMPIYDTDNKVDEEVSISPALSTSNALTYIMEDAAADLKAGLEIKPSADLVSDSSSPEQWRPQVTTKEGSPQHYTEISSVSMDREASIRFLEKRTSFAADESEAQRSIDDIFLFGRPQLLFEFVQATMMLLSLYISLWITNYAFWVVPHWMKLVAFLPYMGGLINFALTVKSEVVLKALVEVDKELVLEVLEEEEAAKNLAVVLRGQILSQLKPGSVADKTEQLKKIFGQFDRDDSRFISKVEYQAMLYSLNIAYSAKKWTLIFSEIDRNFDGYISLDEFILFVFPDNESAKISETLRMTEVQERIGKFRSSITARSSGQLSNQIPNARATKQSAKFLRIGIPNSQQVSASPELDPLEFGDAADIAVNQADGSTGHSLQ